VTEPTTVKEVMFGDPNAVPMKPAITTITRHHDFGAVSFPTNCTVLLNILIVLIIIPLALKLLQNPELLSTAGNSILFQMSCNHAKEID
jgi:hypothetical protein